MPDNRRYGFHNHHRLARYTMSLRAKRVMSLPRRIDLRIGDLESGLVGAAYSVVENKDGYRREYCPPIIAMLEETALLPFDN